MATHSIKEIWKDIEGYEGFYQVSNMGRIKSLERDIVSFHRNGRIMQKSVRHKDETIMIGGLKNTGYKEVILSKNGKKKYYLIHRLVAQEFLENPNNLSTVNHKDENKQNNCVENLEWLSQKDNNNYGERNKKISNFMKVHQFGLDNPYYKSKVLRG